MKKIQLTLNKVDGIFCLAIEVADHMEPGEWEKVKNENWSATK
jgi:hypothetical protein